MMSCDHREKEVESYHCLIRSGRAALTAVKAPPTHLHTDKRGKMSVSLPELPEEMAKLITQDIITCPLQNI